MVQLTTILLIAILGFAALYQFGQAGKIVMDKATTEATTQSYVDDGTNDAAVKESLPGNTEAVANGTLGDAAFLITIAAELALGFLVGLFVKLRTDKDYAAWRELGQVVARIRELERAAAETLLRIESAKKRCMAGIRCAQDMRNTRRSPYHNALVG